jgi:hypothetical protein
MPNITSTTAAPFIPEIWANMALEVLRNNSVLAGLVTKDGDVASFQVGSKLHIPYPGTFTANDKAANAPVTKQAATSTDTVVTLNKHKEVTFLFEDFARAQAQPITMQAYLEAQVAPIVDAIESDLFGLYAGLASSVGTSGTNLSAATVQAAGKKLTDNNLAFDPGAFILAMRALPEAPPGTGAAQAVVHDPVSGLVMRSTMSYNADNLGVQCTLDVLYGVAELRDEKGVVVLT